MKDIFVQLLSHVRLFVTPRTAAHQASLSFTNSWSVLNSCPSNHLIHIYICIYGLSIGLITPVLLPGKSHGWRSL